MACDPDGDRIGIAVKDDRGEWILLNGNQTNIIFTWYIILRKKQLGLLKGNEYTIKTIVTTELIKDIAEKNGIPCYDVYTGFKWIADMTVKKEQRDTSEPEKNRSVLCRFIHPRQRRSFFYVPDGGNSSGQKTRGNLLFTILKEIYAEYGFSQEKMIYIRA